MGGKREGGVAVWGGGERIRVLMGILWGKEETSAVSGCIMAAYKEYYSTSTSVDISSTYTCKMIHLQNAVAHEHHRVQWLHNGNIQQEMLHKRFHLRIH